MQDFFSSWEILAPYWVEKQLPLVFVAADIPRRSVEAAAFLSSTGKKCSWQSVGKYWERSKSSLLLPGDKQWIPLNTTSAVSRTKVSDTKKKKKKNTTFSALWEWLSVRSLKNCVNYLLL